MDVFLDSIYHWYNNNSRDLPWRMTSDPYKIWVSEIILQQTRVAQGTNYYLRFIEKFPNVKFLANAHEDEVLKKWQGLGYYSRARNLHAAAKYIWNELDGVFPTTYPEILKLKGVGPYTAAAIASIAFELPYPAIDGNIYRVLSRYFGVFTPVDLDKGKKEVKEIAQELMPERNAGFHNQALMEFGALQCVPASPNCGKCPVQQTCYAITNKKVGELPVKTKKGKQSERYFYYYYIEYNDCTFLEKRIKNDIWKNLYQFPLFESKHSLADSELLSNENVNRFTKGNQANVISVSKPLKHVLSHQIIYARCIHLEIDDPTDLCSQFVQVNKKDIFTFAVPRLMEQIIEKLNLDKKIRRPQE